MTKLNPQKQQVFLKELQQLRGLANDNYESMASTAVPVANAEVVKLCALLKKQYLNEDNSFLNIPDETVLDLVVKTRQGLKFVHYGPLDGYNADTHKENMLEIEKLASLLPGAAWTSFGIAFAIIASVLLIAAGITLSPTTAGASLVAVVNAFTALGGITTTATGLAMGLGGASLVSAAVSLSTGFFNAGIAKAVKELKLEAEAPGLGN